MGVTLGLLSVLLNPLTMSYVAYDAFRRGGFKLRMAVFVTNFCLAAAFAIGEGLTSWQYEGKTHLSRGSMRGRLT
jgi:hypothetical protein